MIKRTRLAWFTLVELLVTMVVLWLLIGVLFETFIVIWRLALKIRLEKALHDDVIYITQTMQNIIDEWDVALNVGTGAWLGMIQDELQVCKACIDDDNNDIYESWTLYTFGLSGDMLVLEEEQIGTWWSTDVYQLTDEHRVSVKNFYVKLLPNNIDGASYEERVHNGFWLFMDIQTPRYQEELRWLRVNWQLQTFFNIRKYD